MCHIDWGIPLRNAQMHIEMASPHVLLHCCQCMKAPYVYSLVSACAPTLSQHPNPFEFHVVADLSRGVPARGARQ